MPAGSSLMMVSLGYAPYASLLTADVIRCFASERAHVCVPGVLTVGMSAGVLCCIQPGGVQEASGI